MKGGENTRKGSGNEAFLRTQLERPPHQEPPEDSAGGVAVLRLREEDV